MEAVTTHEWGRQREREIFIRKRFSSLVVNRSNLHLHLFINIRIQRITLGIGSLTMGSSPIINLSIFSARQSCLRVYKGQLVKLNLFIQFQAARAKRNDKQCFAKQLLRLPKRVNITFNGQNTKFHQDSSSSG